jgi:uncharacterized LabA/DUF88 family protein
MKIKIRSKRKSHDSNLDVGQHQKRPRSGSLNTPGPPKEEAKNWEIGLFWDYENIRIPKGFDTTTASNLIRENLLPFGRLCTRRLYYDSHKSSELSTDRMGLDNSGFTVVDCPTRNRKEVVDKKIIVDVMCFALERVSKQTPVCVVLMSSDGDFSYMLNKLRDMGVHVIVIYDGSASSILLKSSDRCLRWKHDILNYNPNGSTNAGGGVLERCDSGQAAAGTAHVAITTVGHSGWKMTDVGDDGKFTTLLVVLEEAQKRNAWSKEGEEGWESCWAKSSCVGEEFYKKDGLIQLPAHVRKDKYKALRADAIKKGLLEVKREGSTISFRLARRDGRKKRREPRQCPNCTFERNTSKEYRQRKPKGLWPYCCNACSGSNGRRHGVLCQRNPYCSLETCETTAELPEQWYEELLLQANGSKAASTSRSRTRARELASRISWSDAEQSFNSDPSVHAVSNTADRGGGIVMQAPSQPCRHQQQHHGRPRTGEGAKYTKKQLVALIKDDAALANLIKGDTATPAQWRNSLGISIQSMRWSPSRRKGRKSGGGPRAFIGSKGRR